MPPLGRSHLSVSWHWRDPLILGLLAAGISSIAAWVPSKWNDEAATQTAATRSLAELWRMMHTIDAVHGFYYGLMHFWIGAFGTSNFAIRAPSILAVGLACAGLAVLGARLGNRTIAICSSIAFMVLPRVTWMAMEARSYALTAAVAVWLTVILIALVQRQRRWLWIVYVVLAAAGVMLNVYIALLVLAHGVSLLLARRRLNHPRALIITWSVCAALAVVLAFPILRLVIGQTGQLPFGPLTVKGVANTLLIEEYFTGATPTVARAVAVPPTSIWAAASIALACIGWLLILMPLIRRKIVPDRGKDDVFGLLAVAVPWVAVPTLLIIGYSLVRTPMYTGRYFSFTTPAVALLIGISIAALATRWRQVIALVLFVTIAVPIFVSQRGPTAKNGTDWQQAAAIIEAHAKPGQDIYYGPVRSGSSLSTSKVRDAYPAVLSRLHDITLKSTGTQNGTLWDSQWPLTHAQAELNRTPILWAIVEHYGSANSSTAKEVRTIEQAGLQLTQKWPGSATDVLLFTRPATG